MEECALMHGDGLLDLHGIEFSSSRWSDCRHEYEHRHLAANGRPYRAYTFSHPPSYRSNDPQIQGPGGFYYDPSIHAQGQRSVQARVQGTVKIVAW